MKLIDFDKSILETPITDTNDIIQLLKTTSKTNNFNVLEYYISLYSNSISIINYILKLAKLTPQYCSNIDLLLSGINKSVKLTRLQIAIMLSNSFLCLYQTKSNFPNMNFINLYKENEQSTQITNNFDNYLLQLANNEINNGNYFDIFYMKLEKLKFIFNYFDKTLSERMNVHLNSYCIFERKCLNIDLTEIIKQTPLHKVDIINKKIEDTSDEYLKVDFANKFLGGGVLNKGCVQEELLFLIYPELIVSCIITEKLNDNEVLFMYNIQRYSNYLGYGYDLKFNNTDKIQYSKFVAMDAVNYKNINQYTLANINREIIKAYIGFNNNYSIATGNWGCGVFNGNTELKFLIQLLAASLNKKEMNYCLINDDIKIYNIYNKIYKLNCLELYNYILIHYIK